MSERASAWEEGGEAGGGRGRGGRGRGPPPGDGAPGGRPAIGGGTCHFPASPGEGAWPQRPGEPCGGGQGVGGDRDRWTDDLLGKVRTDPGAFGP